MSQKARTPHPGALPNYQQAEIPRNKLVGYLLDPLHSEGRHKARVFKSALGFEQSSCDELAEAIVAELPYYPAQLSTAAVWGQKYEVTLPITGKTGMIVDVSTVWITRPGTNFPSFVTGLVVGEKSR